MWYDIVVIGGGVIGSCVAHAARKSEFGTTLILDRGRIGGGASDYSAGFDAVESQHPAHRALAIRSRRLYAAMAGDIPEAVVRRIPTYWIVDRARVKTFAENFRAESGEESSIRWLDAGGQERVSFDAAFHVGPGEDVCMEHDDGYAHPGDASRGIVRHLLGSGDAGFGCWEGVEVVSVQACEDGCAVVLADERTVYARNAVLAVGPWMLSPAFAHLAPPDSAVRIKKIGTLVIDRTPDGSPSAVVHYEHGAFFMPVYERARWIFSFTLDVWDVAQNAMRTTLHSEEYEQGRRLLASLAPSMASVVGGAQVFYDAYTADRMPLVYSPDGVPALTVITGCSGAGYRIAPALAADVLSRLHRRRASD